jgi:hypothetical protein
LGFQKKQKSERRSAPRNRYYAGAKLSEHKFLRILQGYAEGVPIQALEPTTHVTGKTVRATYRTLRATLPPATRCDYGSFGGAGIHLLENRALDTLGDHILARIAKTKRFRRYVTRHAPRLRSDQDAKLLLFEKVVRVFCTLDLRAVEIDEQLVAQIAEAFTQLRLSDPLQKLAELVPSARPHGHPEFRLYEDYRCYLLKHPLGSDGQQHPRLR